MMTLQQAYGRNRKTVKEIKADWGAGKDFVIADLFHADSGRYINNQDARAGGIKQVKIRYAADRKCTIIAVK